MKHLITTLLLTSCLFSQDVLTLKNHVTFQGELISITDNFISFKVEGNFNAEKVNLKAIEKLVLADGTLIIDNGKITKGIDKSEDFYKDTKKTNVNVDFGYYTKLRPRWNFHEPKDPFKSGMLSAIVPSGGHFYNEQYSKGWNYLIFVPLLYLAGSLITENNLNKDDDDGIAAGVLIQFSALILHFYNVYDAVISSNNINKDYLKKYLEEEKTLKQNK